MDKQRWRQVRELFESVCDLNPSEREHTLSQACNRDPELRAEVESILDSSHAAPGFLEEPAAQVFPELFEQLPASSMVGRRVGDYELARFIASGGMGDIFLARRADQQYEKSVAIKLIRSPLLSRSTLRHFRTERRSLAILEHPNIARMMDSGVTEDGLPYLVMEYVEGLPIDRFCDTRRSSTYQRLRLFQGVCAAVHTAHQNLIVHRDLKPNNILVTEAGVPKLLDFGIAKILDPQQTPDGVDPTITAHRIMTPYYASPEQIRGQVITTISDVYTLGVILYELLTGHRPYRTTSRLPHEIERTICEEDPEKPSTAIGRMEEVIGSDGSSHITLTPQLVSQARAEFPAALRRKLSGDLDAIILKAMRKEPQHRYASAEQLSEDIQRHLDGRPVLARQDTLSYRTTKFIRRNKGAVMVALTITILLLGGIVGVSWQSRLAERQRDKATQAQAHAIEESRKAETINAFLQDMLASVDPNSTPGREPALRLVLDDAGRRLKAGALKDEPEPESDIHMTLGMTYLQLGRLDEAESHLQAAMQLREEHLPPHDPKLAESLNGLGLLWRARGNYPAAERLYREALERRRGQSGDGGAAVAETMNNLGVLLKQRGQWDEAESLYRKSLAIRRRLCGTGGTDSQPVGARDVATTLTNLAGVLKNTGQYDEAESAYREALDIFQRVLGPDHYRVAVGMNNLALLMKETGQLGEAERLLRQALAIRRKVFGEQHPAVATGLHNLAFILASQGKSDEAEILYRQALDLRRELLGPDHPYVAYTLNNLAELLADVGRNEQAEPLARQALAIRRQRLRRDHPAIASSLLVLGRILVGKNEWTQAEPLLRQSVDIYGRALPAGHWKITRARSELGGCLLGLKRYDEAERLLLESYKINTSLDAPIQASQRDTLERLIRLYDELGNPNAAAAYRTELASLTQDDE